MTKIGLDRVISQAKKKAIVLLVEDDKDYAALIREAFRKVEIPNLYAVSTVDEAIAYLAGAGKYADRKTHPLPCLMLLDLKLPPKSGMDVLRWLNDQPGIRQKMNVVVLSGVNAGAEVRMAYDLGAQFYMEKPDFEGLEQKVHYLKQSWLSV